MPGSPSPTPSPPDTHNVGVTHAVPTVHAGVGHVAGVYNSYPVSTVAGVTHAVPTVAGVYNAHHAIATPAVHSVGVPAVYSNVYSNVYSGLNHLYGKREAEAEAEPLLYTNSLVHHAGVGHVAGVYNSYPVSTVAGVTHAVPTVHAG